MRISYNTVIERKDDVIFFRASSSLVRVTDVSLCQLPCIFRHVKGTGMCAYCINTTKYVRDRAVDRKTVSVSDFCALDNRFLKILVPTILQPTVGYCRKKRIETQSNQTPLKASEWIVGFVYPMYRFIPILFTILYICYRIYSSCSTCRCTTRSYIDQKASQLLQLRGTLLIHQQHKN